MADATATWSNSGRSCLSWVKILFRFLRPWANANATATWRSIKADHALSDSAKDVKGNVDEVPEESLPSPGLCWLEFGQVEGLVSSSVPSFIEVVAGVQVVACWVEATRR